MESLARALCQKRFQVVLGDARRGDQSVTESAMEIATETERHRDMVREWHEGRNGLGGSEEGGVNKPVEVTAVFLSGAGGMGHAAVPVPLGRKIRGGGYSSPPPMSQGTPPMPARVSWS